MKIFEYMKNIKHEQLVLCHDETTDLTAIIAVHDTTLGPALGGTRMWTYDTESEAIEDALRLARGMTYKNAAAGLNLGGGKGVIIADPKKDKTEEMWRAYGRFVQSLNGKYITAEDVGVDAYDMEYVREETAFVGGLIDQSGDPSPATAYGVYFGLKGVAEEIWNAPSLNGKKIAVQGVGSVGYHLCKYLFEEGAKLVVTDINEESVKTVVKEFGAETAEPEEIYDQEVDILAPCALGAVINDETIPRLKVKAIAGAANNQLKDEEKHCQELQNKGILYAPDYIINAGGVINISDELKGYDKTRAYRRISTIKDSLRQVFEIAKRKQITTYEAASTLAERRIETLKNVRSNYLR